MDHDPPTVSIRAYTPEDSERLLQIWLAASRVGHPFLGESVLAAQREQVRRIYLPKAENWVVGQDGQIAGFIGLLGSFIGGLFIDPAAHGRGLGTALVRHAAKRKGDLDVEVYAANPIAPAFYRRNGFHETGWRPRDDEGRPLELIRMHRPAGARA